MVMVKQGNKGLCCAAFVIIAELFLPKLGFVPRFGLILG